MTQDRHSIESAENIRARLALLAARQGSAVERTLYWMREIADVLSHHGPLGLGWYEKFEALLDDAIDEIYKMED